MVTLSDDVGEAALGRIALLRQSDQHNVVLALVTHHHHVRDGGHVLLERILHGNGRDVLATRGNDQLLDAARDVEQAVLVHAADVARVQETVGVNLKGIMGDDSGFRFTV